eukprot:1717631-Amphidinium_carterae.1
MVDLSPGVLPSNTIVTNVSYFVMKSDLRGWKVVPLVAISHGSTKCGIAELRIASWQDWCHSGVSLTLLRRLCEDSQVLPKTGPSGSSTVGSKWTEKDCFSHCLKVVRKDESKESFDACMRRDRALYCSQECKKPQYVEAIVTSRSRDPRMMSCMLSLSSARLRLWL